MQYLMNLKVEKSPRMEQTSAHEGGSFSLTLIVCVRPKSALLCPGGVLVEDNVVSHNDQQGARSGHGHIESLQTTRA